MMEYFWYIPLVLSKSHTAPGLYSALAYRGFFPVDDLPTLRHIDSYLQGHAQKSLTFFIQVKMSFLKSS